MKNTTIYVTLSRCVWQCSRRMKIWNELKITKQRTHTHTALMQPWKSNVQTEIFEWNSLWLVCVCIDESWEGKTHFFFKEKEREAKKEVKWFLMSIRNMNHTKQKKSVSNKLVVNFERNWLAFVRRILLLNTVEINQTSIVTASPMKKANNTNSVLRLYHINNHNIYLLNGSLFFIFQKHLSCVNFLLETFSFCF